MACSVIHGNRFPDRDSATSSANPAEDPVQEPPSWLAAVCARNAIWTHSRNRGLLTGVARRSVAPLPGAERRTASGRSGRVRRPGRRCQDARSRVARWSRAWATTAWTIVGASSARRWRRVLRPVAGGQQHRGNAVRCPGLEDAISARRLASSVPRLDHEARRGRSADSATDAVDEHDDLAGNPGPAGARPAWLTAGPDATAERRAATRPP